MSLITPRDWWNMLDEEFHFTLDVAADREHFMCNSFYTEEDDALNQDWAGVVWCSPPWHTVVLKNWVEKGYKESKKLNSTVVMLLPIQHYETWWFKYALKAKEIRYINGCLEFIPFEEKHDGGFAVEPHCLVIFEPHGENTKVSEYPSRISGREQDPMVSLIQTKRTW